MAKSRPDIRKESLNREIKTNRRTPGTYNEGDREEAMSQLHDINRPLMDFRYGCVLLDLSLKVGYAVARKGELMLQSGMQENIDRIMDVASLISDHDPEAIDDDTQEAMAVTFSALKKNPRFPGAKRLPYSNEWRIGRQDLHDYLYSAA